MITTAQKARIAQEVARLASQTSQVNVANKAGVSNATISQIVNGNWPTISNDMWKALQVNLHLNFTWKSAETTNFILLRNYLTYAQTNSVSLAISEDAGRGKTHAYRHYARHNEKVIHIECQNYWTKKSYMKNIMAAAGLPQHGTLEEMVVKFIKTLKTWHQPLVIIDQFDKLKDPQMDLFMDFYNELDGYCGFLLSGVKALKKKVLNGVNRDKVGYAEMYSRIGRKFINLDPVTIKDVKLICHANDIMEPEEVQLIADKSEGDLRRVKRDIEIAQQRKVEAIKNLEVKAETVKA